MLHYLLHPWHIGSRMQPHTRSGHQTATSSKSWVAARLRAWQSIIDPTGYLSLMCPGSRSWFCRRPYDQPRRDSVLLPWRQNVSGLGKIWSGSLLSGDVQTVMGTVTVATTNRCAGSEEPQPGSRSEMESSNLLMFMLEKVLVNQLPFYLWPMLLNIYSNSRQRHCYFFVHWEHDTEAQSRMFLEFSGSHGM